MKNLLALLVLCSCATVSLAQLDTVQQVRLVQSVTPYFGVDADTLDLDKADTLLYRAIFEIPAHNQVHALVLQAASDDAFLSLITADTLSFSDLSDPDKYLRMGETYFVTIGKLAKSNYCFRILYLNDELLAAPGRVACTN